MGSEGPAAPDLVEKPHMILPVNAPYDRPLSWRQLFKFPMLGTDGRTGVVIFDSFEPSQQTASLLL